MRENDYKKALKAVRGELNDLLTQQAEIERRIAQLRQTLGALAKLCGEDEEELGLEQLGLTEAVREVLKATDKALSPLSVKEALIKSGYDIDRYTNVMASIHTVLKRLANNSKEVVVFEMNGKKSYMWRRPDE